jgi:hypothetical protein
VTRLDHARAVERAFVRRQLRGAVVVVALGVVAAWSVGFSDVLWMAAPPVAVVFLTTTAAADRHRFGSRLVTFLGVLTVTVAVIALFVARLPVSAFPAATVGLATGIGLNRLVFGVLGPIPEERRRRLETAE